MDDLFKTPELIPAEIQAVFDTMDKSKCGYSELERILKEIEALGYTFEYYLDAIPFDLRKLEDLTIKREDVSVGSRNFKLVTATINTRKK